VPHQLKSPAIQQVPDVLPASREEIVQAKDFVTLANQPLAEMGTDESGPTRHQNPHLLSPPC
jgi:hypothetical protein